MPPCGTPRAGALRCPCTLDRASPWTRHRALPWTHQGAFALPGTIDQRAFVPFGNQTRGSASGPPAGIAACTAQGGPLDPFIAGGRVASGTDKRQRGVTVTVRLTSEERARLETLSSRAGLAAGAFMRAAAFGETGPRAQRRPTADHTVLRQLLGELGRVGNNLNQIARSVNSGQDIDLPELQEAVTAYLDIRNAIYRALGKDPTDDHQGREPGRS